jgi:hypothetical protein
MLWLQVVKSEVPDMHVDTIMEFCDVTFKKIMFPMKDMHNTSRISSKIIPESSTSDEYFEKPHVNVFEKMTMALLQGVRDRGLQSLLVMILFITRCR